MRGFCLAQVARRRPRSSWAVQRRAIR